MKNHNRRIAISHEVPALLMEESRHFNDFDYALVHLFETRPDYFDFFKKSLAMGREVILDNSVFELGHPFDPDLYLYWILKLKPTYAIIPDKFEDADFTITEVKKWAPILHSHGIKCIGVAQGSSMSELMWCYSEIADLVDKIAISFAQPAYIKEFPLMHNDYARMYGRHLLINSLAVARVLRRDKPHHLLGLSLPQELKLYKNSSYDFIQSVDSSSPIVHGLNSIYYTEEGLESKMSIKLVDLFDCPLDKIANTMDYIHYNVMMFQKFTP